MTPPDGRSRAAQHPLRLVPLVAACLLTLGVAGRAEAAETIHFGVAPLLPTPTETKKAFEPFFKYLAEELGVSYTLEATTDFAGIAVALASGQVDVAWTGPWGYVIAHHHGGGDAIATAKYDGRPVYHAIIVARPNLDIRKWPEDGKGHSISFADVGSTSGWLIPTYWFQSHGIDPKSYFIYHEGSSHPANEVAVANGQSDLATDYDRNRTAMIENGVIKPDATRIVWTSDDLPNDPIVVRPGLDVALVKKLQTILVSLSETEARSLLPNHYTGFVAATHANYKRIEDAGLAVGKLK